MEPFDQPVVYLVRHGDTDLNDDNRFRGWLDVPLNEEGERSAADLAEFFRYRDVARVYYSDLQRADDTAEPIADAIGCDILCDPNLKPWDVGKFEGQDKEVNKEEFDSYIANPGKRIPGGESLNEFMNRWSQALNEHLLEALDLGRPIVIVTHTSNIVGAHQLIARQNHEEEHDLPEETDIVGPGGVVAVVATRKGYRLQPLLNVVETTEEIAS